MIALRLRRSAVAVASSAPSSSLAACTAIPTSGPVQEGDAEVTEPSEIDVLAEGPQPGDTPIEIVDGFLAAGAAGFTDNFSTAREYLAGEAKATWDPTAGVLVSGSVEPAPTTTETEVTIDVPVEARVGESGVYAEAPPDGRESVTFGMVRTTPTVADRRDAARTDPPAGGLRAPVPAGLPVLRLPGPEVPGPRERWFPKKNLSTSVVSELLAGPSAWLQDAVITAVPDGVELSPEAVLVDDDGVASVGWSPRSR